MLKDLRAGDEVISVDPKTKATSVVKVKELTTHDAKNYALTSLVLIAAHRKSKPAGTQIHLNAKVKQPQSYFVAYAPF
ncbi:hypothetical protein [Pedobacter hartonius]|uniref:Uncharacterized protein n=1 Tax=Pedobacter hartonius TaxID=425514 RepID=A0A1H3W7D5_9SPHI|nr:hypothetical protein [Pedobacter hartonius]SDZ82986.1 hypothetical protein SAMN05443550_101129 [Pedobacter hartonius]